MMTGPLRAASFARSTDPDRQKVIDEYRGVLTLQGSAEKGKPLRFGQRFEINVDHPGRHLLQAEILCGS